MSLQDLEGNRDWVAACCIAVEQAVESRYAAVADKDDDPDSTVGEDIEGVAVAVQDRCSAVGLDSTHWYSVGGSHFAVAA